MEETTSAPTNRPPQHFRNYENRRKQWWVRGTGWKRNYPIHMAFRMLRVKEAARTNRYNALHAQRLLEALGVFLN